MYKNKKRAWQQECINNCNNINNNNNKLIENSTKLDQSTVPFSLASRIYAS